MLSYTVFAVILCSALQLSNTFVIGGIDTGLDTDSLVKYVMTSSYVPSSAKGALAVGKAAYHGVDHFVKNGDIYKAGEAMASSGLQSSNDIFKTSTTVKLAQSGLSLFQDILGGKNVQDSLSERALEALDHLSIGEITKIAIESAKELQNGKSLEDVISKSGKKAIYKYAEKAGLSDAVDIVGHNNVQSALDGGIKAISGFFG